MAYYKENWTTRVGCWAHDRDLLAGSKPRDQMLKLVEEVGELASGIQKNNHTEIEDAIGDCAVVLCILASQMGLRFDDCQESAWEQIKDRKGKMVGGVFVREKNDSV
jgi:NTP pyrophosphatase (non-canonical NTP hydrolase)